MQIRSETPSMNIAVLHLAGRLNMVSASTLRKAVQDMIVEGRTRIVLDLARVSSMDSVGLGTLLRCLKRAREAGGELRIVSPTAQVQTMLTLSLLVQILPTHDSVEAAYVA